LKSAPPQDPRNHPFGNIIRASAAEFFNCRDNKSLLVPVTSTASQSATTGSSRPITSSGDEKNSGTDWRARINNLYADYEYQFTASYRRSAAPPTQARGVNGNDDVIGTDDDRLMSEYLRYQRGLPGGRISTIKNALDIPGAARKKSVQTMLSNSSSSTGVAQSAVLVAANIQRSKKFSPGGSLSVSGSCEVPAAGAESFPAAVRPKSGRFAAAVNAAASAQKQRKTVHAIGDSSRNPATSLLA
jgi:hypothetical protein